jgi:hypothetical protein
MIFESDHFDRSILRPPIELPYRGPKDIVYEAGEAF